MQSKKIIWPLIFLFSNFIIGQNTKGDWLVSMNGQALSSHTTKIADYTTNQQNLHFFAGLFLLPNIVAGTDFSYYNSNTNFISNIDLLLPTGQRHHKNQTYNIFLRTIHRLRYDHAKVFGQIDIGYNRERFISEAINAPTVTKNRILATLGIGLSINANESMNFDFLLSIPVFQLLLSKKAPFNFTSMGVPMNNFSNGFQFKFDQLTVKKYLDYCPLKKGVNFTSWVFTKPFGNQIFVFNPNMGRLLNDNLSVGGSLYLAVVEDRSDSKTLSKGAGAFIKYYFKGNERFYFFTEVKYDFKSFRNTSEFTQSAILNVASSHAIKPGGGVTFFINEQLAVEIGSYHQFEWTKAGESVIIKTKPKDIKSIHLNSGLLIFF